MRPRVTSSSDTLRDAARRIERWLLRSPVQLADGPHAGGIAGWLDSDGRAVFVYLEITGYYLTTMAWLLAGGACEAASNLVARERGRSALDWLHRTTSSGALPPTRLPLMDEAETDWRNNAVFTFDLAMAMRGVAAFTDVAGRDGAAGPATLRALTNRVEEIRGGRPLLASHRAIGSADVPCRWSTLPGPHHLKAAAALLATPVGPDLAGAAQATWTHWAEQLSNGCPVPEIHPLLYGLEGMAMAVTEPLDRLETVFRRLMQTQHEDGSLPAETSGGTAIRSDVLAQALRVGALLRSAGQLPGRAWTARLDLLAERLLEYVRANGSVGFSHDQDTANAWCAMFAHQALVWHSADAAGNPALHRRYLV
jgi:hypothetical protein